MPFQIGKTQTNKHVIRTYNDMQAIEYALRFLITYNAKTNQEEARETIK